MGYKDHKGFKYLHYKPSGKPLSTILFNHGYRTSPPIYDDMCEYLQSLGYESILLARSRLRPQPRTLEQHALETAGFVESLELDKWHSAGHSLGGYIAIVLPDLVENKPESVIAITPAVKVDDNAIKLAAKAFKMTLCDIIETSVRVPLSLIDTLKQPEPCCVDYLAVTGCPSIFYEVPYKKYSLEPFIDAVDDILKWPGDARRIMKNLIFSPVASYLTANAIKNLDYSIYNIGHIPNHVYHTEYDELFRGKILDFFKHEPNFYTYLVKGRNHRWPIRKPKEVGNIIDFHLTEPVQKAA